MKGVPFVLALAALLAVGSPALAGREPLAVTFDPGLVGLGACSDATLAITDLARRGESIAAADARGAAATFASCERRSRVSVERQNLLRLLEAASPVVAAEREGSVGR